MTVRIQPIYRKRIKERADSLDRSEGYIVEEAVFAMFGPHVLGPENRPGRRMDGDERGDSRP